MALLNSILLVKFWHKPDFVMRLSQTDDNQPDNQKWLIIDHFHSGGN